MHNSTTACNTPSIWPYPLHLQLTKIPQHLISLAFPINSTLLYLSGIFGSTVEVTHQHHNNTPNNHISRSTTVTYYYQEIYPFSSCVLLLLPDWITGTRTTFQGKGNHPFTEESFTGTKVHYNDPWTYNLHYSPTSKMYIIITTNDRVSHQQTTTTVHM